jgi:hypothetical protein
MCDDEYMAESHWLEAHFYGMPVLPYTSVGLFVFS